MHRRSSVWRRNAHRPRSRARPGAGPMTSRALAGLPRCRGMVERQGLAKQSPRRAAAEDAGALSVLPFSCRLEDSLRQLCPRFDLELPKDLVQVVLDRARADEHLSGDLSVRASLGHKLCDARFLRREAAPGVKGPLASALPRSAQFDARPFGETFTPEIREEFVGGAQLLASICRAAL